jgi:hypothetical protein
MISGRGTTGILDPAQEYPGVVAGRPFSGTWPRLPPLGS